MTLIVGLIDQDGKTWLACDSIASDGFTFHTTKQPKVFKKGKLLMGYTSSFRLGQLLEYGLNLPARTEGQDIQSYLFGTFVDALRDCLRSGGYARNDRGEESAGNFLVVTEGRIFEVQSNYSVLERQDQYAAVGSGEYHALGVLHAAKSLNLPPLQTLRLVFEATTANVVTVRGPFWVLRPDDEKPVLLEDAEKGV